MLIEDFYEILEINQTDKELSAKVKLNPEHNVYNGHFPEQAVVPGVMQLQFIKEILENQSGASLLLNRVIQVKYLAPITPDITSVLNIIITIKSKDRESIRVEAVIKDDKSIFTKAKLNLTNK